MDLIQSRAMFCRWRNNIQTVSQTDSTTIYFSMDGGTSYKRPSACTLSVVTNTTDMVDVSFKQTYSSQVHAEDWDIHYVLRRGDTSLYVYAILGHPATYPA